jgi:CRISPR-associated protein Csb1
MNGLAEKLFEVVTSPEVAGIAIDATYQPVGGQGDKIMPPSYPVDQGGPYLIEKLWLGGQPVETVVLDQIPSQANRIEGALLEARDQQRIELPLFELTAKTSRGDIRLTSLDFPHRYADAYLRDSLVEGQRFDWSPIGQRLREASDNDARPLYEREPLSLVLGAWDSHRLGRWPKFARVYNSRMFGTEPEIGARIGSRIDPLNLTGSIDDKGKAEQDWNFIADGEKRKGTKLSEIGHGNIAPMRAHGGVSVTAVRRIASVSQASLRRIRFGDAGEAAADTARAALLALALAGDRAAFGRASLSLRSGCDLARVSEHVVIELDGGRTEPLALEFDAAVEAFDTLRGRATELGVAMATDTVYLEPMPALQAAIEHAVVAADPADSE